VSDLANPLVAHAVGENCSTCGGYHWSKWRHRADEVATQMHMMIGGGDKQNILEDALALAYMKGYMDAKVKS